MNRLRSSPLLLADTQLPKLGWTEEERRATIERVQQLLDASIGQKPENVAKNVLKALGCSTEKSNKLDEHRRKRKSRRRV